MSHSSNRTRRLTFATNNGDIAGGEVMLFALAEAARDLGCIVTVVAPSEPSEVLEESKHRGFLTIEIRAHNRREYISGLRTWDSADRSGLLWCNGLAPSFATAGHPQRIVHLHQRPRGRAQAVAYTAARRGALRVVVPSHSMAADLPGAIPLPNWVAPIQLPKGNHVHSPHGTVLGFLGRHSLDKGLDVMADALAILDQECPGRFRLLLAGEARFVADDEAAQVRAAFAPVNHLIDRAGWMERDDFFSSVDLAVFPSVWAEPFGLVVAEAQAARVPFVITSAGALPEVAGPHYPWVAAPGDPASLAAAITSADREVTPAHLDRSYLRWEQEFSPAAGRRRLAELLTAVGVLPSDGL